MHDDSSEALLTWWRTRPNDVRPLDQVVTRIGDRWHCKICDRAVRASSRVDHHHDHHSSNWTRCSKPSPRHRNQIVHAELMIDDGNVRRRSTARSLSARILPRRDREGRSDHEPPVADAAAPPSGRGDAGAGAGAPRPRGDRRRDRGRDEAERGLHPPPDRPDRRGRVLEMRPINRLSMRRSPDIAVRGRVQAGGRNG